MNAVGGRRRARETVFRVAYQADLLHEACAAGWSSARDAAGLNDDQRELGNDVVGMLEARSADIDTLLRAAAQNWQMERLAATDRAVLRVAVAELLSRPGTPARVVIDEAVEIARRFGSDASGRFVNGVLDRVARDLRPAEF